MKKSFILTLLMATALSLAGCGGKDSSNKPPADSTPVTDESSADTTADFVYEYSEEDGGIIITEILTEAEVIVVPDEIDGQPVVKIEDTFHDDVISVTLPVGLIEIDNKTFRNCSELTSITIQDGVEYICEYAFTYCDGLTSITIPGSVIKIKSDAFSGCENLSEVIIEEGVEEIGSDAFWNCEALETITFPDSVWAIYDDVFEQCYNLKEVYLPANLRHIGEDVFLSCPDELVIHFNGSTYKADEIEAVVND